MKKTALIIVLTFLLSAIAVNAACSGSASYQTVEGEQVRLTSPSFDQVTNWRITAGNTRGFPLQSVFLNKTGCSANFDLPMVGNYTITVDNALGAGTATMLVEVRDVLQYIGFGHQCYVIDTSNCADIYAYGDVQATQFIDAAEIYAYDRIHSYGSVSVGNYVSPQVLINTSYARLPATTVTGDLNVRGVIRSGGVGLLTLSSADIINSLTVHGSTTLRRVTSISNAGNPIAVNGSANVSGNVNVNNNLSAGNATVSGALTAGQATTNNLLVRQKAIVEGNVRVTGAEDRIMGPVNLKQACDSVSPRMYRDSNGDFVIEIGNPASKCASGQACFENSDCASGTCTLGVCS